MCAVGCEDKSAVLQVQIEFSIDMHSQDWQHSAQQFNDMQMH